LRGVVRCIARNLRRYATDSHGLWAMVLKTNGELSGDCGLRIQDVDGANEVEIGYHVRRDYWGRGVGN
jgi:[ribosomal protein S5]-alanine N-acetyltransferase